MRPCVILLAVTALLAGSTATTCKSVGIYANARDIPGKTDAELAALQQRKLEIVYLGLESGSDEVLRRVHKGSTAADEKHPAQRELYDLDSDPGEFANLAGQPQYQETVRPLHATLAKELGEDRRNANRRPTQGRLPASPGRFRFD